MEDRLEKDESIEDFPAGTRVILPSGRTGTVVRWMCQESRRFPADRCLVQYDDDEKDRVTLLPRYLERMDR